MIFKNPNDCVVSMGTSPNIFIQSGVCAPRVLIEALVKNAASFNNARIYQLHTEGDALYARKEFSKNFCVHNFFNGRNMRENSENINELYIPIFLSEIPHLFYNKIVNLDIALIQVSPPDAHGMCSLGPAVDITIAAVRTAKKVIAQINNKIPRTFGDAQIPVSMIHEAVEVNETPYIIEAAETTAAEDKIGEYIASLIEDGATLQMGIGAIPNAALKRLGGHKNLGVHTEMFSDGVIDLYEKGIINNSLKIKHPQKIVTSFAMGSKRLYDFIDNNPAVLFLDCAYTNNTHIIAQNPKVTAINSAIEVDLTGQVCADSIGPAIYSGVGGQMDFMRGAALSKGGKPIIALPSQTGKGKTKIVSQLTPGAGVTTTRAHVHYIITEYGVAYLYGKTLKERVTAMINIASPNEREGLSREAFSKLKILI